MVKLDDPAFDYMQVPVSFRAASATEIFKVCNGCGSAQAKLDFVPDTIYGLPIGPACYVHDWDYYMGVTAEQKADADMRFLNNMLTIIDRNSVWGIKWLRRQRAYKYYDAVRAFGDGAFFKGEKREKSSHWWFHGSGTGRV